MVWRPVGESQDAVCFSHTAGLGFQPPSDLQLSPKDNEQKRFIKVSIAFTVAMLLRTLVTVALGQYSS